MIFKRTEVKKLLVWTWTDINKPSGTPSILITLFNLLHAWQIVYVCGNKSQTKQSIGRSIRVKYFNLIDKIDILSIHWFISLLLDFCIKIPFLTILCIYTVLKEKPRVILTVFFNRSWIVSSYLAARILGREVTYYVHDPFKEKFLMKTSFEKGLMFYIERKIMSDKATKIVVLNDGLKELYEVYKPSIVLRNISTWDISNLKSESRIGEHDFFKIAFSGSVYENNRELVYSLVDVVSRNSDYELHMFGNYGKKDLSYFESIKNVTIRFIPAQDLLFTELQNFDLHYLPLSFIGHKDLPLECLQPVFPTKTLDYILTNKPILLHCPENFFLASFFKKYEIGYCLHSREKRELEIALRKLASERKKSNLPCEAYKKLMHEFSVEKNMSVINSLFP